MFNHQAFRLIDHLVRQVATTSMSYTKFKPTDLNPEFTLDAKYKYSEAIDIYAEAMQLLKNKKEHLSQHEMCEYVFEYIQRQSKRITDKDAYYRRCEKKNQESLHAYLTQLLNHYARLLFVRVDFSIQKKYQHEIDLEQFQDYLKIMSNRYSNQDGCFSDLQGHAWAIEEGFDKGLHCHTLLIYDGNKRQNDAYLGGLIQAYWSQLTKNKGYCFISNTRAYKQQFEEQGTLGIGMIHRDHKQEVKNALNTAQYLVNPEKELQHLRVRLPRMRTFGTGQFEIKKRRGLDKPRHLNNHAILRQ